MTSPMVDRTTLGLHGYPVGAEPGWVANGGDDNTPITYTNPRFGTLAIGMHPSGNFDQWLFREINGGGVLVIPWTLDSGVLRVAMLKANRPNLGGDKDDYEAVGGFQEGGETVLVGAIRELMEEAGLDHGQRLTPLAGRYFASNRAFFVLDNEDEGCKAIGMALTETQTTLVEGSADLVLMRWDDAVRVSRDALTIAALARLRASLDDE